MNKTRKISDFFLGIESRARAFFEQFPFIQAFLAGVGVIIFWRGVWELLDRQGISPVLSIVIGALILGGIGVFLQTFIGNTIIIKNVSKEVRDERKAVRVLEGEVVTEEVTLQQLADKLDALIQKIDGLA